MSKPRTNPRLGEAATKVLRKWHDEHYGFPYPSAEEKAQLHELTGLSDKQISNWFTNTRRRSRSRSRSSQGSNFAPGRVAEGMSCLDRWRHSPPELEPVSLQDIAAAVAQANSVGIHYADHNDQSQSAQDLQVPIQQSESSCTWASDASTSDSQSSSPALHATRKHRRRSRKRPNMSMLKKSTEGRVFQCTFCTDAFKTKYDWTRHEASLHLALDRWICTPFGPRYLAAGRDSQYCVYCDCENPTDDHLDSHRSSECSGKPVTAREFYRKDHLKQHVRQFHNSKRFTSAMEGWKSKVTEIRSRCGFCDEAFQTWSDRSDHLAEHFRNGSSMKDWTGARGFEPAVATRVRHSIPPYLINSESTAMIPFSAERTIPLNEHLGAQTSNVDASSQPPLSSFEPGSDHNPQMLPTPFEHLVSELGKFVISQKKQNIAPSDQELQGKARLIVYGDDDPWNQTAADNSQWLDLFKTAHGLSVHVLTETEQQDASFLEDSIFDESISLPWYWQSPECLASYRQNRASFLAAHDLGATSISDNSGITWTPYPSAVRRTPAPPDPRCIPYEQGTDLNLVNDVSEEWRPTEPAGKATPGDSNRLDHSSLPHASKKAQVGSTWEPSFTKNCDELLESLAMSSHDLFEWR